jgi:hypothetical protein
MPPSLARRQLIFSPSAFGSNPPIHSLPLNYSLNQLHRVLIFNKLQCQWSIRQQAKQSAAKNGYCMILPCLRHGKLHLEKILVEWRRAITKQDRKEQTPFYK